MTAFEGAAHMKTKTTRYDYKWVIIALCFLMVFTCLGFCSSNKSIYIGAITDSLDMKRSAFALSDSSRFIATAVINLFFGSLVARFGTKKLICAGFLCLIFSMLINSFATSVPLFCIGGIFLGIGLSWTTTTMVGAVVTKWSKENKGTIMGAILAANGLGGALAAQIVTPIIYEVGNPFGYRNAYRLVALILAVVGALIMVLYKEKPKNHDDSKAEVSHKKSRGQSWVGVEYSKAIKKRFFYTALICIFFTGCILQSVNGIAGAHLKDSGLDVGYIATVLSVNSVALTVFKFLTGFVYDKFGIRITTLMCFIAAIITMVSLTLIAPTTEGCFFAMVYAIFSSLSLPLETIMLPIYAGELFGEKSFNKIMGIFVSVNTAGYAVGGVLMNGVYDIFGSYIPGLLVSTVLISCVCIILQFVLTTAHKYRKEIEAQEAETTVCA